MTVADLTRNLSRSDLVTTLDLIDLALHTATLQQLHHLMTRVGQLIPLEKTHVSVAELDARGTIVRTDHHVNVDFPSDWLLVYRQQRYVDIDPAAKLLFIDDKPLYWRRLRALHRSANDRRFYGCAREFGLRDGFSFGARFVRAPSASFFSCAGTELTCYPRHLTIVEHLLPHLHAALSKVYLGLRKVQPLLTAREIEVLNWARFGKTNWDISVQLDVSERAVKYHLENAMHKLDAGNRSQAVATALSHGLIDWG